MAKQVCGAQCRTGKPCTLRTIRHAERLLHAHPELTFWMEVSFAAHGVGFPAPKLVDSRAVAELRQRGQQDPRLVECAIAHAAEQAIQPRYDGLKSFYDPQALGEHLTDIATTVLLDTARGGNCSDDRGRWRACSASPTSHTGWRRCHVAPQFPTATRISSVEHPNEVSTWVPRTRTRNLAI